VSRTPSSHAPRTLTELLALCPTRRTRARTAAAYLWLRCGGYRRYRHIDWSRVHRLIFVCKGNVCRSPYAEAAAIRLGIPAVSCGVHAAADGVANPTAIEVARSRGLSLDAHCPRPITEFPLSPSDLVLAMEPWHAEALVTHTAAAKAQVTLLGLWAPHPTPVVPDPYGQSIDRFESCFALVEAALAEMHGCMR
jgi:protein-tyrosine phosphatase